MPCICEFIDFATGHHFHNIYAESKFSKRGGHPRSSYSIFKEGETQRWTQELPDDWFLWTELWSRGPLVSKTRCWELPALRSSLIRIRTFTLISRFKIQDKEVPIFTRGNVPWLTVDATCLYLFLSFFLFSCFASALHSHTFLCFSPYEIGWSSILFKPRWASRTGSELREMFRTSGLVCHGSCCPSSSFVCWAARWSYRDQWRVALASEACSDQETLV